MLCASCAPPAWEFIQLEPARVTTERTHRHQLKAATDPGGAVKRKRAEEKREPQEPDDPACGPRATSTNLIPAAASFIPAVDSYLPIDAAFPLAHLCNKHQHTDELTEPMQMDEEADALLLELLEGSDYDCAAA